MFLHLSVSHFVHREGVHPPRQTQNSPGRHPPSRMVIEANGTHPTRMHSCFFGFFLYFGPWFHILTLVIFKLCTDNSKSFTITN